MARCAQASDVAARLGDRRATEPEEQVDYQQNLDALGPHPNPYLQPNNGATFNSSHWDTPNVVAHLRLNDRTGADGENLLHMEELQSDWGQGARGTRDFAADQLSSTSATPDPGVHIRRRSRIEAVAQELFQAVCRAKHPKTRSSLFAGASRARRPDGPYIGNTQQWTDLGLKRALIEAANGGYSHLSWTPGEDQAARYSLEQHISDLSYYPPDKLGRWVVAGARSDGRKAINETTSFLKDWRTYVGQETAAEALSAEGPLLAWRASCRLQNPQWRLTAGAPSRAKTSRSAARG